MSPSRSSPGKDLDSDRSRGFDEHAAFSSLRRPAGGVPALERAWHYRELIRAVVRRELAARFRGSILGWLWAVFGPLVMLTAYTIIFSNAVGVPKSAQGGGVKTYALSIFIGLILFNLFSELMYRAPGLLHEHVNFIKKSIFPSETLAWTASIRALTYAAISFVILLIFMLMITTRCSRRSCCCPW
jgi:ABC-type polysaccharide/polyol phosphate export systems, permease component